MNADARNILLVILGFAAYYLAFEYFAEIKTALDGLVPHRDRLDRVVPVGLFTYFITYVLVGLPIFLATALVCRDADVLRQLGLKAPVLTGLLVAALATLPMFAGSLLEGTLPEEIDVPQTIANTAFAGFFEELYFRGFFFGLLFCRTRLGFISSVLLCSLVFASVHMYQSTAPAVLVGIFLTTFLGSALFAWLYAEWRFNLWVPIWLHALMNLSWALAASNSNALGSAYANIFRVLTIALVIGGTVWYKRRNQATFEVRRSTLWWVGNNAISPNSRHPPGNTRP